MNKRKILPLALLYATKEGRIDGRTRFQKLIFLMQKEGALDELSPTDTYRFKPYDYGPFSSTLYDDLDEHIERELIDDAIEKLNEEDDIVKYEYQLKDEGWNFIEERLSTTEIKQIVEEAERIMGKYGDLPLPELIDLVYSKYPEYAKNSVLR